MLTEIWNDFINFFLPLQWRGEEFVTARSTELVVTACIFSIILFAIGHFTKRSWMKRAGPMIVTFYCGVVIAVFPPLMSDQYRTFGEIAQHIVQIVLVWTVFFHFVLYYAGPYLTKLFSTGWVKGLDYIYLAATATGIVKTATTGMDDVAALANLNTWGVVVLCLALSLRFTKTTVEIMQWQDKTSNERTRKLNSRNAAIGGSW